MGFKKKMILYGLKNCDTCRKAMKTLEATGVTVEFHDVRVDGVSKRQILDWAKEVGWEKLLNTRSTTWRGLPAGEKEDLDQSQAVCLMADHPTLIKRPVIEAGKKTYIGWSKETQAALAK